ncbi:cell division protein DivIVA [Brachybacterium ginsengisoli]|uniref:Cell division protein DivIVA n=1 Tax=Brachybacterium ginsengisoli TaxID=1331682 RepID=A0A291GYV1_9MICO|nr:DivIVA domain-containing protein [Brachybacterium ginsengisoli]ATG55378.1 cell division protein DivIVA [Brachybacterium ginsengisoli]
MDVRFTPVRFAAGYEMAEVDDFLDRCEKALASGDGSVTAETVLGARFRQTRFSEAYDTDEVDQFLDDVLAPQFRDAAAPAAASREPAPSGEARPRPADAPAAGSGGPVPHPAEQRGFLSRLFGRR